MPRGGGDCCMTREQRNLANFTVFCHETFNVRVSYLEIPVIFVRCLNPFPFGIGQDWIGDGDGTKTQGHRERTRSILTGDWRIDPRRSGTHVYCHGETGEQHP